MKKSYFFLLTVVLVIASIIVGGCLTSNNQAPSSETSTNASITSSTTTTVSTKAATSSPIVSPSPSTSPTSTPTPSVSGKIATSIQLSEDHGQPPQLTFAKGERISWVIKVRSPQQPILPGPVTVRIDGQEIGQVTPWGACPCEVTAWFDLDTSGLTVGTHTVTVRYPSDSTYQASELISEFKVT